MPMASLRAGLLDGVIDALLSAQHVLEMFRRVLPNGAARTCLDWLALPISRPKPVNSPHPENGRDWPVMSGIRKLSPGATVPRACRHTAARWHPDAVPDRRRSWTRGAVGKRDAIRRPAPRKSWMRAPSPGRHRIRQPAGRGDGPRAAGAGIRPPRSAQPCYWAAGCGGPSDGASTR
jgi:hypothetical protein